MCVCVCESVRVCDLVAEKGQSAAKSHDTYQLDWWLLQMFMSSHRVMRMHH